MNDIPCYGSQRPEIFLLSSTCLENSHKGLEGEQREGLKVEGKGRPCSESHANTWARVAGVVFDGRGRISGSQGET